MKNSKGTLYVFHFLGNSDIKVKKDVIDKFPKIKEELNLREDRNNKELYIINQRNFREITEKITKNLEKYRDIFIFDIIDNEKKALNYLFPNWKIKFILIYTNQKNDEEKKKDTIYLYEIIKSLNVVEIEGYIELSKVSEPLLFEKIRDYIANLEKNKKQRNGYVIFSSAGIPIIKPASVSLLLLNSVYRNSPIFRFEISEHNKIKILNWDIFRLLSKSFIERDFIEFLRFTYSYLYLIKKLEVIRLQNNLTEDLRKISYLVEYLYRRLVVLYFESKKDFEKLRNNLKKLNLVNNKDYLLIEGINNNLTLLLSKIQDFDIYVTMKIDKEAVLTSTAILDLLGEVLIEKYKIKEKSRLKNCKKYFIERNKKKERIDTEKNNFYSILPYIYESNDETIRRIKNIIFGEDKIIRVKENDKEVIFEDLMIGLRKQRNDLAHRGYFEGGVRESLKKLNNIYKEIFKLLTDEEFEQILWEYREKLINLINTDKDLTLKLN